jgi:hypothetical protein
MNGTRRKGVPTPSPSRRQLLLTFLAVSSNARTLAAREPDPIRAGHEGDVQALLLPYRLGMSVHGDERLESLEIQAHSIELGLAGPSQRRVQVELLPPEVDAPRRVGPFGVEVRGAVTPDETAAVEALLAAVARNGDAGFWNRIRANRGEPEPRAGEPGRLWYLASALGLVAAVVAVPVCSARFVRASRRAR